MERTLVKESSIFIGEKIKLQGWVHRIRKLGRIAFVMLRDRTGVIQCVVDTRWVDIKGMKLETVVEVIGTVREVQNKEKAERAQALEINVETLDIISAVKEDLSIEINKEKIEANMDAVLNNRVLSLRHKRNMAIFKIQAAIVQGFQTFLNKENFTQVFTSKIVAEGTEGGTGLFELKYFEKKAYLAQSPQFYKQMMVGSGFERVYEIGHVYRAEEHNTKRHLNEYVSLDLEMGFIEDEKDLMELETRLLKEIFEYIQITCKEELKTLAVEMPEVKEKLPTMRLEDAIQILKAKYGKIDLDEDIDPEGERLISEYVKETYGSDFVFLTHYPKRKRPMYAMPCEETLTHSFDLIFRGVEITTGGQRIHDYEMLKESIASRGVDPKNFGGYLSAFKYGMPPHGGLAIGLERLTGQLVGVENVREVTLFPRDRDRITP